MITVFKAGIHEIVLGPILTVLSHYSVVYERNIDWDKIIDCRASNDPAGPCVAIIGEGDFVVKIEGLHETEALFLSQEINRERCRNILKSI